MDQQQTSGSRDWYQRVPIPLKAPTASTRTAGAAAAGIASTSSAATSWSTQGAPTGSYSNIAMEGDDYEYSGTSLPPQGRVAAGGAGLGAGGTKSKKGKGKKELREDGDSIGKIEDKISLANGEEGAPRSGRACLACRKLKTRCDGADDPPCKRCRSGGHDCVFVESKRGKRPPRKAVDQTLAEKFRTVEKTLSMVLNSMNSGAPPDPTALHQLQASLAEGIAADAAAAARLAASSGGGQGDGASPSSESDGEGRGGGAGTRRGGKRARRHSQISSNDNFPLLSSGQQQQRPFSATDDSPMSVNSHLSPLNPTYPSSSRNTSHSFESPASHQHHHQHQVPTSTSNSLSILADASLAAEIDGRSQVTGLDPSFTLSSVTSAIQVNGREEGSEEKTPGILSKGIVDPETAVELFRIFFDYAYIHLPLLDPSRNTATAVCARSPFLFTVICAVASRFHLDPLLHIQCYDEAHECFVDCVANGERSIDSVQACMILTVWTNAPKTKAEDRPQRAWLYFGMAVRMGLELGLFRPPAFVDAHLVRNASKANPWANLKDVSEEEQREALNRERTWLLVFVIDRNMSAVMGRPYQIHEVKPLLIPLHPMSLPFDLGVIAHQELQSVIGQVMDTFRDRIYGLSSASDEMPSPVVMKLFNSRMDEWKQRWCPVAGEPIANNLLFYFFSSKLFLNTFPLHTMLRSGDAVDDPECVSTTISAAKAILDLGHKYAELGVLRHCPDVNFLLLLYAAVFLIKVKASNTRFAQLVDSDELQGLMLQSISDCQAATCSSKHAASTCMIMLRALFSSWKAMSAPTATSGGASFNGNGGQHGGNLSESELASSHTGGELSHLRGLATDGTSDPFAHTSALGLQGTLSGLPTSPTPYTYAASPFHASSRPSGQYGGGGSGTQTPNFYSNGLNYNPHDPLDSFLNDTHFFNSVLVSQGADGFFSWAEGLDSAAGMDLVNHDDTGMGRGM